MVVSVDEARSAPAGPRHRMLRRALLVATVAAGGWLLSALFAAPASAAEEPSVTGADPAPVEQPAIEAATAPTVVTGVQSTTAGLVEVSGAVQRTVAHTVAALGRAATETVLQADIRGEQAVRQVAASQATTRSVPRAAEQVAPRKPVPHKPPATPAHPKSAATAPEHSPGPAAPKSRAEHAPIAMHVDEHADNHVPTAPAKPPAPAASSATSVSGSADNAGGARGAVGELSAQAPLLAPTAAGYTTRSRAADATGRVDGLPATSPD